MFLLFDLGALPYDLITWQEGWRAHCRLMARAWAGAGEACRVLDLGTGPAVSAIEAARERPGDRLVGLDLSSQMLARARKRVARAGEPGRRVSLVRADARSLPFPDRTFDAATGHSFLYLVPFRERALAEASRVLRPGARLVLLEPRAAVGDTALAKLRADTRSILANARDGLCMGLAMALWRLVSGVKGRFAESALCALLDGAGFVDVRLEPTLAGLGWLATARRP